MRTRPRLAVETGIGTKSENYEQRFKIVIETILWLIQVKFSVFRMISKHLDGHTVVSYVTGNLRNWEFPKFSLLLFCVYVTGTLLNWELT